MRCFIETNEQMGFLAFMMSDKPQSEDQELLTSLLREVDSNIGQDGSQPLSAALLYNLPKMKNMDDMKKFIIEYCGKDEAGAKKLLEQIDKVYPEYHKMYEEHKPELDKYVKSMNEDLNGKSGATEYLEKVGKFFGWDIPKDREMTGFVYLSYTSTGCSLSKEGGTYQTVGVTDGQYDSSNQSTWNRQQSKWVHESVHGIFEESGAEKKLMDYLQQPDNPFVKFMEEHPEFRRNEKETPLEAARALFDESMTTALQGMFEQEKLGENRKVLYQNPIYNIMAHKMMSILSQMMKEGKTFDEDFIKRFEKEFFDPKTQEKLKEEIKNRKCQEGVQEYLKQQYEKQGKPFPKDFFAPKGHPNYNEEHWKVANELLEEFKERTDSTSVLDEKFFKEFEKDHPESQKKVSDMVKGNERVGIQTQIIDLNSIFERNGKKSVGIGQISEVLGEMKKVSDVTTTIGKALKSAKIPKDKLILFGEKKQK